MDKNLAQQELRKVGLGGKKRNFGNWFGERISEADSECVCVRVCARVCVLCRRFSHVRLLATPMDCSLPRRLCPWGSPDKNTAVGCHALLQGSSRPRDQTHVSCISCLASGFFNHWATGEAFVSWYISPLILTTAWSHIVLWISMHACKLNICLFSCESVFCQINLQVQRYWT